MKSMKRSAETLIENVQNSGKARYFYLTTHEMSYLCETEYDEGCQTTTQWPKFLRDTLCEEAQSANWKLQNQAICNVKLKLFYFCKSHVEIAIYLLWHFSISQEIVQKV